MNKLAYFRKRIQFMSLKERAQLTTALGMQGAFEETGSSCEELERHLELIKDWEHGRGKDPSRLE